ncbi:CRP-like cAMP-binding protein [Peptoniphilus ivorii]|uniref:Crp/Fnr family transcriptional regulator n=1 Tax=Aedoeadaptatus ivorii TaxID=54006 RepID=UPI00278B79AE|nr:Crp/Fnr family transcriptional regulator [Peptoniphilus ivorii]MDQ0508646.1 CRP-like cAMP-binding protein [Peptoniphilus ivorii]
MDTAFLTETELFAGIRPDEMDRLLVCLSATRRQYKKGDTIFSADTRLTEIGLVLTGSVHVIINYFWGDANIFGHVEEGEIFGEAYAALHKETLTEVVAAEDAEILFLNMHKILTTCEQSCAFHHRLIYNIVGISARKNLALSARMVHIAPKSIRDRVFAYLSQQALEASDREFSIPFSRQELADYLGVNRSALSAELSRMQKDGKIAFHKNRFRLLEGPAPY